MVSAWVPFNVVILPFVPLMVFLEDKGYILNTILLHLVYFPVALVSIALYIAVIVALYPVSYLIINLKNLQDLTYCRGRRSWPQRFLTFIIFLIIGPFQLLFYTLVDLVLFIRNLYATNLQVRGSDVDSQDHNMEVETLLIFIQSL